MEHNREFTQDVNTDLIREGLGGKSLAGGYNMIREEQNMHVMSRNDEDNADNDLDRNRLQAWKGRYKLIDIWSSRNTQLFCLRRE